MKDKRRDVIREILSKAREQCYSPGCEQLDCYLCTSRKVEYVFNKNGIVVPTLCVGDTVMVYNSTFDRDVECKVMGVNTYTDGDVREVFYEAECVENGQVVVRENFTEEDIDKRIYKKV